MDAEHSDHRRGLRTVVHQLVADSNLHICVRGSTCRRSALLTLSCSLGVVPTRKVCLRCVSATVGRSAGTEWRRDARASAWASPLRATLDALRRDARVVVAELDPVVVRWCRGPVTAPERQQPRGPAGGRSASPLARVSPRAWPTLPARGAVRTRRGPRASAPSSLEIRRSNGPGRSIRSLQRAQPSRACAGPHVPHAARAGTVRCEGSASATRRPPSRSLGAAAVRS